MIPQIWADLLTAKIKRDLEVYAEISAIIKATWLAYMRHKYRGFFTKVGNP